MPEDITDLLEEFEELLSNGMHLNFADGESIETMSDEDKIRIAEYVRELKKKKKE